LPFYRCGLPPRPNFPYIQGCSREAEGSLGEDPQEPGERPPPEQTGDAK
jgi:hypothetical protein